MYGQGRRIELISSSEIKLSESYNTSDTILCLRFRIEPVEIRFMLSVMKRVKLKTVSDICFFRHIDIEEDKRGKYENTL